MAYRDDLIALSARHDALAAEVAQKTRELRESRRLLEQARARARLPVLDQIQVATPCTADWSRMTGDDRVRHCGECQKNVYNLSGMTREEAQALIIERNGDLCVRYYERPDGTILLADCSVGVQRKRRQRRIASGAAALVAGGLAAAGVMGPHVTMGAIGPRDELTREPVVMGGLKPYVQQPAEQNLQPREPLDHAAAPPSMRLPPELQRRHYAPKQPRPDLDGDEVMGKPFVPVAPAR